MKKFVISVTILGVIFSILIILISSLIYTKVTDYYFDKKISENILVVNKSVSTSIASTIHNDYEVVKKYYTTSLSDDVLSELSTTNYSFGSISEVDGKKLYHIGTEDYVINKDTEDDVRILSLRKDFTTSLLQEVTNDLSFLMFRVDNKFIYFSVDNYFKDKFTLSTDFLTNEYFIINSDGVIAFQSLENKKSQFYYYLRETNDEAIVNRFKEELVTSDGSILLTLNLNHEPVYLSYSKIKGVFDSDLYVVNAFSKSLVRVSENDILTPTVGAIVAYTVIVIIGIWVTYYLLIMKNNDLKVARMVYGANRDLLIKINNKGDIIYKSEQVKMALGDNNSYTNINSFKTLEKYDDIIDAFNNNLQVTLILDSDHNKKYLSFISVKNGNGYKLYGMNLISKEKIKGLQNEVMYNKITGLPNEKILLDNLEEFLNTKREVINGVIEPLEIRSLIIIEITNFKDMESIFGVNTGNMIIRKISETINNLLCDEVASFYQLQDNLFAVYLEKAYKEEEVVAWIKNVIQTFKKPIVIEENSLVINASFGVAFIDPETYIGLDASGVYSNALAALKKTKTFKGSLYSIYDLSLNNLISKEQLLEQELRLAIDRGEFVLHLQPQYNNEEERIGGFEALIRWNNPKYIKTSPAHFIELAEKNNMIVKLGHFIITETFRIAKKFEPYNIKISMNVSPVQLLQAGFINEVLEEYKKADLKKNSVAIEITETFLMNNFSLMIEKMKLLHKNGFEIHLDDFGTGYSSMLYLRELPIDAIKIDKEFTKHINTDKYSQAIVSKIISLAKILDLDCIAEGVENDKQNQFLYKNGCDIIQGYLISPAVEESKALELVEEYNINKKVVIVKKTKSKK